MKFKELTKKQLNELIEKNNSLSGILRDMGIKCNSGNYQTLHRYANKFDLYLGDILNDNSKYIGQQNGVTYKLSEILIKDSSYGNTHCLKNRLFNEGIKERKCEKCGQDEWWNGEKMSLILDHINGVHNDNRIENLRIVCPNCNATFPTHGGRNRKKINKTLISQRKVERPSYEQLNKEVEEMGYSATGRKYGVSDNAIRKWIIFYKKYKY